MRWESLFRSRSPSLEVEAVLGTRHIFVDASCCLIDALRVTTVFLVIFSTSSTFCVMRHTFSALRTCFLIRNHTAGGQTLPSPPSGHPHPSHPADIFHPSCWRSNSPLSAQRSSHPVDGGQPHPSPPIGHLPPILADERRETQDARQ